MKAVVLLLLTASLTLPALAQPASNSFLAPAATPRSIWSINIVGLKGEPLGAITMELSGESARTCMSGEWKKVRVIESSFPSLKDQARINGEQFGIKEIFPTYRTDGQIVVVQLNPPGLCDAYELLSGQFTERDGRGDYVAMGLRGIIPMGTFSAKRRKR